MIRQAKVERTACAKAIQQLRTLCEQTQEQFARRLEVAVATLGRYEIGAQTPGVRILRKLRDVAIEANQPGLADFFATYTGALPGKPQEFELSEYALLSCFLRFISRASPREMQQMEKLLARERSEWSEMFRGIAQSPNPGRDLIEFAGPAGFVVYGANPLKELPAVIEILKEQMKKGSGQGKAEGKGKVAELA